MRGWCPTMWRRRPTRSRWPETTDRPSAGRLLALAAFGVLLAISSWRRLLQLGRLSYDYDEGAYWQSLESMRHGHRLFGEAFSSQPPAFLGPLSPAYDLLGGGIV